MKNREQLVIELNNSLVPIVTGPVPTGRSAMAACSRALRAVRSLSGQRRSPDAQTDLLARAGLRKIENGAAVCVAGEVGRGKQLITDGLAERTAATEQLDNTLEGE